jgi:hypothetical protein
MLIASCDSIDGAGFDKGSDETPKPALGWSPVTISGFNPVDFLGFFATNSRT